MYLFPKLSLCMFVQLLSHIRFFATQWTVAHQAALSMGCFRQEYWSGLLCPPTGDLPDPGIEQCLLHLLNWQMCSLPLAPLSTVVQIPTLLFDSISPFIKCP